MGELFQQQWVGLLFGVLSAALIGLLSGIYTYFKKQINEYKKLLEEQDNEQIEELIDKKLEVIVEEIEELRNYVMKISNEEKDQIGLITSSYRYRLIQLCKLYLKQGYMTQEQYDQLTEFYKLYSGLGGNGQAKEYYERAIKLDIHDNK